MAEKNRWPFPLLSHMQGDAIGSDVVFLQTGAVDASSRATALAHVRDLLRSHGVTDAEIDQAIADDVLDLFVVDRMLVPSRRRYTRVEVAELTGVFMSV